MRSAHNFKLLSFIFLSFSLIVLTLFIFRKPTTVFSDTAAHIVISEAQIAGATTTDEFVELYNPTSSPVNLTGWTLLRKTAAADAPETLLTTLSGSIPAHGFYLITNNTLGAGFDAGITPDATYTEAVSDNNTLILRDSGNGLIDLLGMGTSLTNETASVPAPITNRSLERKALAESLETDMATGGAHETFGNGEDTNNNLTDFVRHVSPSVSTPQNSSAAAEVPSQVTETPTPTLEPTTTPTGEPTPTEILTPTPTEEPTVTPTENPTPTESPTPTVTPSPTPDKGIVIGHFIFPKNQIVCRLTFQKVKFFRSFFFTPTITCTRD